MKMNIKFAKLGFTLAEILIATAVMSLFIVAVFDLYSMGSKMFTSGSWRQQTQKDAEIFMANLHKSLSQVAVAARIDNSKKLSLYTTRLGYKKQTLDAKTSIFPVILAAYPVVKSSIRDQQGLIMYYMLVATSSDEYVKNHNSKYKDVCNLELIETTSIDTGKGNEFFTKIPTYSFVDGFDPGFFAGLPAKFGFGGGNTNIYKLKDVASCTVSLERAGGDKGGVIRVDFMCKNPNNTNATISLNTSSRIANGIVFQEL